MFLLCEIDVKSGRDSWNTKQFVSNKKSPDIVKYVLYKNTKTSVSTENTFNIRGTRPMQWSQEILYKKKCLHYIPSK